MHTSLGYEDYATSAIEKLLEQTKKPANAVAWIRKTIANQQIELFRNF
jgi:hypothetical protein